MIKRSNVPPKKGSIYTLAQSGTDKVVYRTEKPSIIVNGEGSDLLNDGIWKKGKRKLISQVMALSLIDVAKEQGHEEMIPTYWNIYYCQNRLICADNRIYGTYCKNRICTLCLANRKAEMIRKYLPVLSQWENPYFLTLSVKSCKGHRLKDYFLNIKKAIKNIIETAKKRHQRGKGPKCMGLMAFESNFNPIALTYNPHIHLIVSCKEIGEFIRAEWLNRSKVNYTYKKGQFCEPLKNKEKGLIELIKYGSKIFTEPDIKKAKDKGEKIPHCIYVAALHTILRAMKGIRIFERFGFNLPKGSKRTVKSKKVQNFEVFEYSAKYNDWMNREGAELLLGYKPTKELLGLIEKLNVKDY